MYLMCLKKINFVVGALKKCLNLLHCILCKYSLKLFCFVGCLQILMAVCRGFILVLKFVLLLLLLLLLSILPKHFLHVSVIFLAPTTSVCRGCNLPRFHKKTLQTSSMAFRGFGGSTFKSHVPGGKIHVITRQGSHGKIRVPGAKYHVVGVASTQGHENNPQQQC